MNSIFKNGVKLGLIIWLIGIILTIITHLIFGWSNPHAPPTSFVVVCITLITVLIRMLTNIRKILFDIGNSKNKGELIVHLLGIGIVLILFVISIY